MKEMVRNDSSTTLNFPRKIKKIYQPYQDKMLCACSGEQFKFEEAPQSPESLATRAFSASALSSRTGDWDSRFEDAQVDEVESTLKEALSLNYEEARALMGRLEYRRGNCDAALQVFQGIDIKGLTPRITKAIVERTRLRKARAKGGDNIVPLGVMTMHSVSLLLEAIFLKAKSLEGLGRIKEAGRECKIILDTVESAFPDGFPPGGIGEDCKLQDILHKVLELLPKLWTKAGFLQEATSAYRCALVKPWNLTAQKLAAVQKELASILLYGGVEINLPSHLHIWGSTTPKNNAEEAILLLFVLMRKVSVQEIDWDPEIMEHLTFALTVCGQFTFLATHIEQALPGVQNRADRWYLLALSYSAAGQTETALNLVKKALGSSETKHKCHIPSLLLGATLASQDSRHAHDGIKFAREVIRINNYRNGHFMAQARRLLGVSYASAAKISLVDSERMNFQKESLKSLSHAALVGKEDPETLFSLGLENATQRNLDAAFDNVMTYSDQTARSSSGKSWKLLALIVSAEQRFGEAETLVDLALDEAGRIDQLELFQLKGVLQLAQEQPKQAIETFRILLSLIQAQNELKPKKDFEVLAERGLEIKAWQDLVGIYTKLGSLSDAEICADKAMSIHYYSSGTWHTIGKLFEAQLLYEEALVSYSMSLSIDPDYVPSIVPTAQVLMKLSRSSNTRLFLIARSYLLNALRLEPTNHEAWLNLGFVSKAEGSTREAADYFQAASELEASAPVQSFDRNERFHQRRQLTRFNDSIQ